VQPKHDVVMAHDIVEVEPMWPEYDVAMAHAVVEVEPMQPKYVSVRKVVPTLTSNKH
jgi:hypothetical protein